MTKKTRPKSVPITLKVDPLHLVAAVGAIRSGCFECSTKKCSDCLLYETVIAFNKALYGTMHHQSWEPPND
jgi:hypothetical protein